MIKKVIKDTVPTLISLMLLSTYAVIDGLFIGNNAGDVGLAAINIAWPITALITAVGVGLGIGSSVLISHKRGLGDDVGSRGVFSYGFAMLLMAVVILMLSLLPSHAHILSFLGAKGDVLVEASKYAFIIIVGMVFQLLGAFLIPVLRNYGMSVGAMICMLLGTFVNAGVNYMLICVLKLGIQGAAYGTLVAQFSVSICAIIFLVKDAGVSLKPKFSKVIMGKIAHVGLTGFGVSMAPSITLIFTNLQCLAYGGDSTVACYAVISYVAMPIQAMLAGVGEGSQPLMSYYCGGGEEENLRKVAKIARVFGLILSAIMMLAVLLATPFIAKLFGLSPEGSLIFDTGMRLYAISFVIVSMARFNVCYLNAAMKTSKAIFLTYFESLCLSPLLLFVLPHFWDVEGIWLSYLVTNTLLLLIYLPIKGKNKP